MINYKRDSNGKFLKGNIPHNYKGGFTNCIDCGSKTHSYRAERCVECNIVFRTGMKYNNCKHVTPLKEFIRKTKKYKQWTKDCFVRDNYTCIVSGIKGCKLVVHHIKYFSDIIKEYNITTFEQALSCEELWNIDNGITLCDDVHKLVHSK